MRKGFLLMRIRENLVLGLLAVVPMAVTVWVLTSFVNFLDDRIYAWLPLTAVHIPGLGMVADLFFSFFFGSLARTVFGKYFVIWSDFVLSRIPFVRGVYGVVKQMSSALFSQDATSAFKQVVLVPFPSPSSRAIAFVTGHYSDTETVVFVPTAPNPTGGYVLIFKNTELEESHMPVHEALQMVISCGAAGKKHP